MCMKSPFPSIMTPSRPSPHLIPYFRYPYFPLPSLTLFLPQLLHLPLNIHFVLSSLYNSLPPYIPSHSLTIALVYPPASLELFPSLFLPIFDHKTLPCTPSSLQYTSKNSFPFQSSCTPPPSLTLPVPLPSLSGTRCAFPLHLLTFSHLRRRLRQERVRGFQLTRSPLSSYFLVPVLSPSHPFPL